MKLAEALNQIVMLEDENKQLRVCSTVFSAVITLCRCFPPIFDFPDIPPSLTSFPRVRTSQEDLVRTGITMRELANDNFELKEYMRAAHAEKPSSNFRDLIRRTIN